jgi:hypothetical protein
MLTTVILIVLVILLLGAIPGAWPHSKDWGRGPIGLLTLVLVIVLIIALLGGCVPAPVPPLRP